MQDLVCVIVGLRTIMKLDFTPIAHITYFRIPICTKIPCPSFATTEYP